MQSRMLPVHMAFLLAARRALVCACRFRLGRDSRHLRFVDGVRRVDGVSRRWRLSGRGRLGRRRGP